MRRARARALGIALVMLAYVTLSRVLGEQYPFGPLSMFSGGLTEASRFAVRTSDGRRCELASFEGLRCDGPIELHRAACRDEASHAENDRKLETTLRAAADGPRDGAPIEVVRRTFRVERTGGRIVVDECLVARCTAKEIPGTCGSTR